MADSRRCTSSMLKLSVCPEDECKVVRAKRILLLLLLLLLLYVAVFFTLHFYKVVLPQKCMYVFAVFIQILRKLYG
jgi:hypothetical protein